MPKELDYFNSVVVAENGFTNEECSNIIDIGKKIGLEKATLSENDSISDNIRNSSISWIKPNFNTNWIFERVAKIVYDINNSYFQYEIDGIFEDLQFTEYTAPGGKFSVHRDCGTNMNIRKLSFTLQLSDPLTYDDGELIIHDAEKIKVNKKIGTFAIFPSFVLHEVVPVSRGTRNSLVGWISGPRFR